MGRPNVLHVIGSTALEKKKKIDEAKGYLLILGMQAILFSSIKKNWTQTWRDRKMSISLFLNA